MVIERRIAIDRHGTEKRDSIRSRRRHPGEESVPGRKRSRIKRRKLP